MLSDMMTDADLFVSKMEPDSQDDAMEEGEVCIPTTDGTSKHGFDREKSMKHILDALAEADCATELDEDHHDITEKSITDLIKSCQDESISTTENPSTFNEDKEQSPNSHHGLELQKQQWLHATGFYDVYHRREVLSRYKVITDMVVARASRDILAPNSSRIVHDGHNKQNNTTYGSLSVKLPIRPPTGPSKRDQVEKISKASDKSSNKLESLSRKRRSSVLDSSSNYKRLNRTEQHQLQRRRQSSPTKILPNSDRWDSANAQRRRSQSPISKSISRATDSKVYFILKTFNWNHLARAISGENLWVTSRTNEQPIIKAYDSGQKIGLFFTVHGSNYFWGYGEVDCRPLDAPLPSWFSELGWDKSKPFFLRWRYRDKMCFENIPSQLMNAIADGRAWSKLLDGQRITERQGDDLLNVMLCAEHPRGRSLSPVPSMRIPQQDRQMTDGYGRDLFQDKAHRDQFRRLGGRF